jgi:ankyrin repeat protein
LDSYAYDSTLIATYGLLEFGVDVNTMDSDEETLLFAAVARRDDEYVRKLLERGANPNAADTGGRTPLSSRSGGIYH